ncbi:MAG TPA: peptidylprolyl isomerase [Chloroflexi bacterium]|jgi:FKBP-type peptidyl-prolyl cis-trans isomerase SlyD|nr:peptidylprolyl isomerase [Chloroflexota bacterium]
MLNVTDGTVVSLEYALRLEDGEVVDSSEGTEPLTFIPGKGQLISGLEKALYGMSEGQEKDIVVEPGDGYGEFESDLFETLPRSIFPPDLELEEGMGFRMHTESGEVAIVYVDTIEDDAVVVNLNHPLAGERLFFHVKIVGVRAATPEELAGDCGGGCSCGTGCGSGCC